MLMNVKTKNMEENTSKEHRKLLFKHEQYEIKQLCPATDNLR